MAVCGIRNIPDEHFIADRLLISSGDLMKFSVRLQTVNFVENVEA